MRIGIVTLYTPDVRDYGVISAANKEHFGRRHGYRVHIATESLDTTRQPAWSKVLLLARELENFDWVFWTDADSVVMNMSTRLESLIERSGDVDMILGSDVVAPFNTGQWLVRRCAWSQSFLDRVWNEPKEPTRCAPPWDQGAVTRLLEKDPTARARVAVRPLRELNATIWRYYTSTGLGTNWERTYKRASHVSEYVPGDFIVHFMFCKDRAMRATGIAECSAWAGLHATLP